MSNNTEFDTICVECDGKSAVWTRQRENGNVFFTGDREIVEPAKEAASQHEIVPVFGYEIAADSDDPVGALAALFASNPGRTQFVSTNVDNLLAVIAEMEDSEPFESTYMLVDLDEHDV